MNFIHLLRRSTNSTSFIPEIDGLRFYAIMTVVIFHLNTAFSRELGIEDLGRQALGGGDTMLSPAWWIIKLDLGVKVFFAISGMVLALPFLKHYLFGGPKVELMGYFFRRLTRLEPPFVVSLIIFTMVHVVILGEQLSEMSPHFWAGLFYAHVFIYGVPNPINPVTWSLETEAQFYILVPFFFMLLFLSNKGEYRIGLIVLLFAVSAFLRGYFLNKGIGQLASSVIAYFSNFLVGIVFAWWYLKSTAYFKNKSILWDIAGLICIVGQFYFYKPQAAWLNNVLFNLFVFGMLVSTFKGTLLNRFFTLSVVYIIGGMCYSIYLLHYAFFHLLVKATAPIRLGGYYGIDLFIQVLICVPIVLMVSALFYILIEKPCMNKDWPQHLADWFRIKLSIG